MTKLKGADISEHQGKVSFSALKRDLDFVIARSSWGMQTKDKQFDRNQRGLRNRHIPRWFYHYSYPNHNRPDHEADHFVATVGQLKEGEALVLDMEEAGSHIVDWSLTFLKRVEDKTGVKPLIYMNSNFLNSYNWQPVVDNGNGLWLANFGRNNGKPGKEPGVKHWSFYAIWQYTSRGSAAGISPLDLNKFYGDLKAFKSYGKKQSKPTKVQKLTRLAEDRLEDIKKLRNERDKLEQALREVEQERDQFRADYKDAVEEIDELKTANKQLKRREITVGEAFGVIVEHIKQTFRRKNE